MCSLPSVKKVLEKLCAQKFQEASWKDIHFYFLHAAWQKVRESAVYQWAKFIGYTFFYKQLPYKQLAIEASES